MATLLQGMQSALYIMNRLRVYLDFCVKVQKSQARQNLEVALIKLYASVLQFLARSTQLFSKGSSARAASAIWRPDVDNFQSDCERLAMQVEIEAQNCDREVLAHSLGTIEAKQDSDFQRLEVAIDDIIVANSTLGLIENKIQVLWNSTMQSQHSAILRWISPIPYVDNHATAGKGWIQGTGLWVFQHPRFVEWNTSPQPMILWIHGIREFGSACTIRYNALTSYSWRWKDKAPLEHHQPLRWRV